MRINGAYSMARCLGQHQGRSGQDAWGTQAEFFKSLISKGILLQFAPILQNDRIHPFKSS